MGENILLTYFGAPEVRASPKNLKSRITLPYTAIVGLILGLLDIFSEAVDETQNSSGRKVNNIILYLVSNRPRDSLE